MSVFRSPPTAKPTAAPAPLGARARQGPGLPVPGLNAAAVLGVGIALGCGINLAGAAPSEVDRLQALERRVAALEQALTLTDDGLRLSSRNSTLTLSSRGVELRGRRLSLAADDQMSISAGTQSELKLDKYGAVELRGLNVDVRGSKGLTLKGSKIAEN